jgi:O-antigen/teichoic acid export membrane protein
VFSFAEGLLFLGLALEIGLQVVRPTPGAWRGWSSTHLRYGLKSVVSGMLLELNARVDVLMLGVFLDDARVGIYSFAAMLAEGCFQLLVVLQNNYNPVLARQIATRRFAQLEAMVRKGKRNTYLLMAGVGLAAVAVYPLVLDLLTNKPGFQDSFLPFAVLIGGIVLMAGYYPFSQTLLMANRPGWHTGLMVLVVASNVLFNRLLIPHLEIEGAALGTALSFLASVIFLKALVRARVGVRL